jgi:hypothetical protein
VNIFPHSKHFVLNILRIPFHIKNSLGLYITKYRMAEINTRGSNEIKTLGLGRFS